VLLNDRLIFFLLKVSLEEGENVFTVLEDLDLPSTNAESGGKRSLFRKAKDNIMSRLSDDKSGFFTRKAHQNTGKDSASNSGGSTAPSNTITF